MKLVILKNQRKTKEEIPYYIKQMVTKHYSILEGNADFVELIEMEMKTGQKGLTNLFNGESESAQGFFVDHNNRYTIYWAWLESGRPKGLILCAVNLKLPDKTHSWLFSIMAKQITMMLKLSKKEEEEIFYFIVQQFCELIARNKESHDTRNRNI